MPNTLQDNKENSQSLPLFKRFSKKTLIIASGVILILLIFIIGAISGGNNPTTQEDLNTIDQNRQSQNDKIRNNTKIPESVKKAVSESNTFVYGAWRGKQTVISSVDLSSSKSTALATLPVNIKKVSVLSPKEIVYIDATNDRDHGNQINTYAIKEKKVTATIKASNGFGIDDYVLSPNKQYMAIWEVSMQPGSEVLAGGRSRVFAVKLSEPGTKYLLYDEIATNPIHYPRAVLDNGKVFTDKFRPNEPNGGAGWAYGMSVADFNGSNKKDVDSMQDGTYGTQPSLSPDGKYLVFSGYDNSLGDGKAVSEGFRQALLTPTTIELLDTTTLVRTKLTNLPNSDIYPSAEWGATPKDIVVSVISKSQNRDGLFKYDIEKQALTRLSLPDENTYSLISSLSSNKYLIATSNDSLSSLGNLGSSYMQSLTKLYYYDASTNHAVKIPSDDPYIQYITTLPPKYFQSVLGMKAYAQGGNPAEPNVTIIDLYSDTPTEENLQLKTFLFKPVLNEEREEQQSDPLPTPTPTTPPTAPTQRPTRIPFPTRAPFVIRETINCRDLARAQCGKGWNSGKCVERTRKQLKEQGKCNQSPLYLYGQTGQNVHVQILTTVYNDNPVYKGGYDVTLGENGRMQIGGSNYQAITYDYQPNLRKITPPTRGVVANRSEIEKVLRSYAKKLGLNEKETNDLVNAGKTKTSSPYVFISFFDQKVSEQILPLSFKPRPDNYLNVVFYFKQLDEAPNYSLQPPVFPAPVKRTGFTAIEVSEIVE